MDEENNMDDVSQTVRKWEKNLLIAELFGSGILIIVLSLLGPLFFKVLEFRTSESMIFQVIGQDLISLLLITPLLFLSCYGMLKNKEYVKYLLVGTGGYQIYTYFSYVIAIEYALYPGNNEMFFFAFAFLIIAGWVNLALGFKKLSTVEAPSISSRGRKIIAIFFVILGCLFLFQWLREIISVQMLGYVQGRPDMYSDAPNGFWTIKTMDVCFTIPLMITAGYLLLTRFNTHYNLIVAIVSYSALLVSAVFTMSVVQLLMNDPNATIDGFVMFLIITVIVWLSYYWLTKSKLANNKHTS